MSSLWLSVEVKIPDKARNPQRRRLEGSLNLIRMLIANLWMLYDKAKVGIIRTPKANTLSITIV